MLSTINFRNLFTGTFLTFGLVLFFIVINMYKGNPFVYVLFTIISFYYLTLGFKKDFFFFDTFMSCFLFIGFWLKFSIRFCFSEGQFHEAVGHFDYSSISYDKSLIVASLGLAGLVVASLFRKYYLFGYRSSKVNNELTYDSLCKFYLRNRLLILILFVTLILLVCLSNLQLGIYQRGSVTLTYLPYGLNGIYKWLLLFGFSSFSALIIFFELKASNRIGGIFISLVLIEVFLSNISMLSRGMILNSSAILIGLLVLLKRKSIKVNYRNVLSVLIFTLFLIGLSVLIVNKIRAAEFYENIGVAEQSSQLAPMTKPLFIDRWVGIEGVMSVISYKGVGWDFFKASLKEKYDEKELSYYDKNVISSPYYKVDRNKHHFVSLPGVIAFLYYTGSYLFVFFGMLFVGVIASQLEFLTLKLGGGNLILCSLFSEVIAYRLSNFGYVPAQSYLLLGSIFINILFFYLADKFYIWYKRDCV